MGCQNQIFSSFHKNPSQSLHFLVKTEANKKKEKWKIQSSPSHLFGFSHFFLFLHLLICTIRAVSSQSWDGVIVTQADYQALQAFKHELVDTKGFLKSWNDTGYGACSGGWAGIKCAQGQVIVIQLPWKVLGGRITEKIGELQALRKLSLHDNAIGGSIPSSLGFLQNLRGIQLFNNRLSGSIPASIGSCPLLQTLDFSNNLLFGSIPESLANSTKLYRLNLSFNSLSGSIPISLTHSPSLIFIALQYNNLSGSIPDSVGKAKSVNQLQKLKVFNLRKNRLSGHIPATIGNISGLTQLDLAYNNLTGEIPNSIGDLTSLNFFNVSYNNLSGPVPIKLSQKFNSSSFVGNLQLCGYSPSNPCPPLSPPPSTSPPPSPKTRAHHRLNTKDIILIAAGALLLVLLLLCCILLCCLIRKKAAAKEKDGEAGGGARAEKGGAPPAGGEAEAGGGEAGGKLVHFDGPLSFAADDLLCATAEIMGKSTYGTVYKATLEDASQVAVKRLREKITKGAYYLGPKGEKLLVFDYMPKGSLASFLHARGPDTPIDWPTRMKIAQGTARGLLYLHTHVNIIHGNLTSSNVLLDEHTNAKISDYGLSRLMTAAANSNVIATAGALGYRAPELSKLKKANTKTDVYSLGVIILELLTGKSPGEAMNGTDLPQWVFDLELMSDANAIGDELLNTLKLALHCVDPSPSARPEVQQIVQQLEEIRPPETGPGSSGDDGGAVPSTS
ncbi:hypothetical protein CsSME_00028757 [Camellia sinensis var. sinensis]